jgi:hypothetical protein
LQWRFYAAAIVEEPPSIPGATADVSRPLKASLDRAQATIIQGSLGVLQVFIFLVQFSSPNKYGVIAV